MRISKSRAQNANDAQATDSSPPEQTTTITSTATGRLLKRAPSAERLGISETKLRRLEKKNELPSVIVEGVNFHPEEQLVAYQIKHSRTVRGSDVDGELSAAAFVFYDEGGGPADAVKTLKIPMTVAMRLHKEWTSARGGFFVDSETAAEIEQLALNRGETSVTDGASLLAVIKTFEVECCASCDRRTPSICLRCYAYRPKRAENIAAAAQAAAEQRETARARQTIHNDAVTRAQTAPKR